MTPIQSVLHYEQSANRFLFFTLVRPKMNLFFGLTNILSNKSPKFVVRNYQRDDGQMEPESKPNVAGRKVFEEKLR